jgi:hypothetical protein
MHKQSILLALAALLAVTEGLATAASIDLKAYAKCTEFALAEPPAPPGAEEACLGPATQGLPGAQYSLGAILLSRGKSGEAIQWLEKAVSSHHPPASHLLAEIYLQTKDAALQARGKELLRYAVCAGYPPAQSSPSRQLLAEPLGCSEGSSSNFEGTWTAALNWLRAPPGGGSSDALRVTLSGSVPKVYLRSKNDWIEAKPGKFHVQQLDDTLVLSALDSGWDLDGKWVESWTIHLLRLSSTEATMYFVRTVNNIYVPESTGLRVFTSVAEGKASRSSN